MQLSRAKLCLDCDEIYIEDYCPRCTSKLFKNLTDWIPPFTKF